MGSARFGQVAGALSQGLGLFAGKKADEEKEAMERKWQEALMAQRERYATDRQEAGFEHSEALAATAAEAADTRQAANIASRETEGAANRTAAEKNAIRENIRRREASLDAILKDIEKRRADALENYDPMMSEDPEADRLAINGQFDNEMSKDIQSHVARMVSKGFEGYEAESEADIKGLLTRNRMPVSLAGAAAKHIFKLVSGSEDLFGESSLGDPKLTISDIGDYQRTARPPGYSDQAPVSPVTAPPVTEAPVTAAASLQQPTAAKLPPLQDQGTAWQDRVDPRTGKPYPMNELFRTAGEFPKPPAGEDPYALMGQRR